MYTLNTRKVEGMRRLSEAYSKAVLNKSIKKVVSNPA